MKNPPRHHHINCQTRLDTIGIAQLTLFALAAALQGTMVDFDPPTATIPVHLFDGLLEGVDGNCRQQQPFYRLFGIIGIIHILGNNRPQGKTLLGMLETLQGKKIDPEARDSSRTDLDEKGIWSLSVMLTNVEDAFRSLKSDLDFRPVFHRKEFRVDAHLFIAVLAYHLLVSIQAELKKHDIFERWWHIRELLSNHIRVTTSMTNIEGEQIHIRNCSDPEPFNKAVYNALGLKHYPLRAKRIKV